VREKVFYYIVWTDPYENLVQQAAVGPDLAVAEAELALVIGSVKASGFHVPLLARWTYAVVLNNAVIGYILLSERR
jgi:hypothetical protein